MCRGKDRYALEKAAEEAAKQASNDGQTGNRGENAVEQVLDERDNLFPKYNQLEFPRTRVSLTPMSSVPTEDKMRDRSPGGAKVSMVHHMNKATKCTIDLRVEATKNRAQDGQLLGETLSQVDGTGDAVEQVGKDLSDFLVADGTLGGRDG